MHPVFTQEHTQWGLQQRRNHTIWYMCVCSTFHHISTETAKWFMSCLVDCLKVFFSDSPCDLRPMSILNIITDTALDHPRRQSLDYPCVLVRNIAASIRPKSPAPALLFNSLKLTPKQTIEICITGPWVKSTRYRSHKRSITQEAYRGHGVIIDILKKIKALTTSNISRTLAGNKIVDHWDVIGASPVGAAPTTSSFSTKYLASMDWTKTSIYKAKQETFHVWDLVPSYIRDLTVLLCST